MVSRLGFGASPCGSKRPSLTDPAVGVASSISDGLASKVSLDGVSGGCWPRLGTLSTWMYDMSAQGVQVTLNWLPY